MQTTAVCRADCCTHRQLSADCCTHRQLSADCCTHRQLSTVPIVAHNDSCLPCECVCVRACVRACMRACVRACVCVCLCVCVCFDTGARLTTRTRGFCLLFLIRHNNYYSSWPSVRGIAQGMCHRAKYTLSHLHANHTTTMSWFKSTYNNNNWGKNQVIGR